jgi:hypothetical protein
VAVETCLEALEESGCAVQGGRAEVGGGATQVFLDWLERGRAREFDGTKSSSQNR